MSNTARYWAIIPAAGIGKRMGESMPKQYLSLAGSALIEYSISRILAVPDIASVAIVLNKDHGWWHGKIPTKDPRVVLVEGGAERYFSVHNAMILLRSRAADQDWVIIHDAVRPCLRAADLGKLLQMTANHPCGGLLGVPVRDTIKRVNKSKETTTIRRSGLWHAQTPQVFRFGMLYDALKQVIQQGLQVTDEAEAMEKAGHKPFIVEGHTDNIKITRPEDLDLAEFFMQRYHQHYCAATTADSWLSFLDNKPL